DDQQPDVSQGVAAGGRPDGNPPLFGDAVRSDVDRCVPVDRRRSLPRAPRGSQETDAAIDRTAAKREGSVTMSVKCEEYNQVCVMSLDGDFAGDEINAARKAFEN